MDNTNQHGGDSAAVTDGRRIYLGNLLYSVKPEDVDAVLQETGLGKYDKIHLSFDPVSGRNPGYCFVEFFHKDDAEQALATLAEVEIAGRPLKVGPCIAKAPSQRQQGDRQPRTNALMPAERWGDWRSERRSPAPRQEREDRQSDVSTPHRAIQHNREMATDGDGKRLYVGGLAQMVNQEEHNEELRGYFEGFDVKAIGKRITPHESTRSLPGNHHYCFVDFETAEGAKAAMEALNGKEIPSGALKISVARAPRPRMDGESPRRSYNNNTNNDETGNESSPRRAPREPREPRDRDTPARSLMSNNWRTK